MKVADELASYPASTVTVRVISAVLGVVPGAPPLPPYSTVEEAARSVLGGVPDDVVERALELSGGPGVEQAMFAARSIDTGDTGLTIVSGVRSAMALFFGGAQQRSDALAQQQRTDAALKALALAYIVTKLVPLPPAQRVELIGTVPAGAELLLYFGAIEIALPFAAEVEGKQGRFVRELLDRQGGAMADKLLGIVGRQGVADAQETLGHLVAKLDEAALRAAPHAKALAEKIRGLLPGGSLGAGDLFDLVAAGADALPCYRYLCARLAVEASLALAKHEKMPEVPLPSASAAAPVPAAPPIPEGLADPFAESMPPGGVRPSSNPFAPAFGGSPFAAELVGAPPVSELVGAPPVSELPSMPADPFADSADPFAAPTPIAPAPTATAPTAPAPTEAAPPSDASPPPPEPPSESGFADGILPPLDEPAPFAWPTALLPEAERLRGCFLEEGSPSPSWRVFTAEGVYAEHPPEVPEGVDWDGLRARGHRVAVYRRAGDAVTITEPGGGVEAWTLARDAYTITLSGRTWRRTDWDLSGRKLDGRWRSGADELVLGPDGTARRGARAGTYALGVGRIDLVLDGVRESWSFLSDLRPSSKRPAVLFVGGVTYGIVG